MGEGQALYVWITAAWRDLFAAAAIGALCGFVAFIGRLRRGDQSRAGVGCLIADCLIAALSGDVALLGSISISATIPATILMIFTAGYLGQVFLDRIARKWSPVDSDKGPPEADG